LGHEAPALALGTRRLDHLARAAAARAGLAELEEPLVAHHLAAARAGAAALAAGARLLPRAAAVTARLGPFDLEGVLAAARDLLERQRQVHLEARAAPAARAAEQLLEEAAAGAAAEDVAERREDVLHAREVGARALDARVAELVVAPALLA